MSFPTAVNDQITDAVTQSNVKVVGEAPAMALGTIYQTMAHSTGILFENAVSAQQQQNALALAASNMGVMQIYSLDTAADAGATEKVGQLGVADNLTSLLTVLKSFTEPDPPGPSDRRTSFAMIQENHHELPNRSKQPDHRCRHPVQRQGDR